LQFFIQILWKKGCPFSDSSGKNGFVMEEKLNNQGLSVDVARPSTSIPLPGDEVDRPKTPVDHDKTEILARVPHLADERIQYRVDQSEVTPRPKSHRIKSESKRRFRKLLDRMGLNHVNSSSLSAAIIIALVFAAGGFFVGRATAPENLIAAEETSTTADSLNSLPADSQINSQKNVPAQKTSFAGGGAEKIADKFDFLLSKPNNKEVSKATVAKQPGPSGSTLKRPNFSSNWNPPVAYKATNTGQPGTAQNRFSDNKINPIVSGNTAQLQSPQYPASQIGTGQVPVKRFSAQPQINPVNQPTYQPTTNAPAANRSTSGVTPYPAPYYRPQTNGYPASQQTQPVINRQPVAAATQNYRPAAQPYNNNQNQMGNYQAQNGYIQNPAYSNQNTTSTATGSTTNYPPTNMTSPAGSTTQAVEATTYRGGYPIR
jgi:hypothetical protein